jgi:CHAD domain-containing protein
MTPKRQIEAGEFFYRFFKKRTSSFHANLYKAGITASEADIHKARVDLKKVFALFSFFEVLGPGNFRQKKFSSVFKKIFIEAGRMRENQLNIAAMEQYQADFPGVSLFIKYLRSEQKKSTKGFINAVVQFDETKLKEIGKTIRNVCQGIKSDDIISRSEVYIRKKANRIQSVCPYTEDPENVHTIRKELKKMGAIVSLLKQVRPGEYLENLTTLITATETYIGEWHDRIVLISALDRFLKSTSQIDEESVTRFKELQTLFAGESSLKLQLLMPYVENILRMVLEKVPGEPSLSEKNNQTGI